MRFWTKTPAGGTKAGNLRDAALPLRGALAAMPWGLLAGLAAAALVGMLALARPADARAQLPAARSTLHGPATSDSADRPIGFPCNPLRNAAFLTSCPSFRSAGAGLAGGAVRT